MDVIPPGWVDLGATGLLALVFLFVILGWLVPKRVLDRALAERDETIRMQRETIERLTNATQNLAVPAHTASVALRSIASQAESSKGGDE